MLLDSHNDVISNITRSEDTYVITVMQCRGGADEETVCNTDYLGMHSRGCTVGVSGDIWHLGIALLNHICVEYGVLHPKYSVESVSWGEAS
jgi:hypothetical protein